jgi:hypothetical protein
MDEVEQCCTFRAERAAIDRMVHIALDMNDFRGLALGQVALGIQDDAARHRAIGAGVAGLSRARELEGPDRRRIGGFDIAEPPCTERRPCNTRAGACYELAPREFHVHGLLLSIKPPPGDTPWGAR